MISLPCTYNNGTLEIKCLNIIGEGKSIDDAFFKAIKNTPELYSDLCMGKTEKDNRNRYAIIIPYSQKVYDRIIEVEPFPSDKIRAKKDSQLIKASAEDLLKYGYKE
jgi:hypothetical protein